jgi:putative ABC transport system permease protein
LKSEASTEMWREMVFLALREIRRNALRSSLTMLGVVIGVAAVIVMVTLGSGATVQVSQEISKLGTNLLDVRPGQGFRGGGGARAQAKPFDLSDVEAIENEIGGIAAVAPVSSRQVQVVFGSENWSTTVTGTDNDYFEARSWSLASGRQFHESELRSGKAVCILGSTVRREILGNQDALGANVRIEHLSCEVIGVLESKGQSSFGMDQDDLLLMPLRTFQRRIAGDRDVNSISISVEDERLMVKVQGDIEQLLRERRNIKTGDEDDFFVGNMEQIIAAMTGTTRVLTALLGAVAAVSLLVGGIGIMNIMLVSVTERTREIGIRLSIGAMAREVLTQFLVEALVLSSFGGLLGITVGVLSSAAAAPLLGVPFVLEPGIILLSFAFSAAVGIVFGYFPARQAAHLDPIEALRYE